MKKAVKKQILRVALSLVCLILTVAVSYVIYVFAAYYRIPDGAMPDIISTGDTAAATGTEYTVLSYNIGFAAYTPDFGFFMDGGKESRAFSKASVQATMAEICAFLQEQNADLLLLEEVDTDSTRSYHIDQLALLRESLGGYSSVFALNYDSPYLFYPLLKPHGKSVAGIATFGRFAITSSVRRSLPIETGLMKLVDLDRCYTASRIPVENGKELVVYTVHLSAYTSDGKIANEQLQMLIKDMQAEYDNGNYVICGGDFNKDLLGDSSEYFGVSTDGYTWATPLPENIFDGTNLSLIAPLDQEDPVPSCRNADGPYHEGQLVLTVDGFLVSDNVTVVSSRVIDTGFAWSDHNPVEMKVILNP